MKHLTNDTAVIGILGLGNMGGAIAEGLIAAGFPAERLAAFDLDRARVAAFPGRHASDVQELASICDVLIAAVKPHVIPRLLAEITCELPLVISVGAGLPIASLRAACGNNVGSVVRAMPNTAASIGRSTSALVAEAGTDSSHTAVAEHVFSQIGEVIWLSSESLMHTATALVGSAPAFIYVLAEALADAAVLGGLPRPEARRAAASMLRGAGELLVAHDGSPAELKDRVASPGGTTIAGLCSLEETGFRASAIAAISATARRSEEMA